MNIGDLRFSNHPDGWVIAFRTDELEDAHEIKGAIMLLEKVQITKWKVLTNKGVSVITSHELEARTSP